MKKIFIFILIITGLIGTAQGTIPAYPTVKLTKLAVGTKQDSVVVINADKTLKQLPTSAIKGTTNLDATATPTNITVFSSTGNDAMLPLVTNTNAGLSPPASKIKLDGIEPGAQVNVPTNLNNIPSATTVTVFSSTGAGTDLPLVTITNAGLTSPADKTKLNNIAAGATANQTDAYLLARTNHTGVQPATTISEDTSHRFTTDAEKATWDAKQATLISGNNIKTIETQSVLGSGNIDLSKVDVGLSNVDNTSDANKPVSTATQTALDTKVDKVAGERLINASEITKLSNQSGSNTGDETAATIKTKLGITTLSGSNTGDQTLSGLGGVASNTAITGATNTKITYDSKGLVTGGASLTAGDIPTLNQNTTGTASTITGNITKSQVTNLEADLIDKQATSQKNTANGYAGLGSDGKLISSQLPSITISDTFVTASQAAMLALTAETGDVAVRTDLNKSFILKGTNPTVLADWQELLTPTSVVTTVFGRNGAVTAQTGDYTADQITETARKFQTATQNTNNDATSSIQGQFNGKQASLGFTPYNATNPAGYISSFTETDPNVPAYSKSLSAFSVIKSSTDALYEPLFSKLTAFNKNFGTASGTVAEGNDSRILNGQTAYGWGNHAGLYPTYSGTGATGTWSINISGLASNSTLWNGFSNLFSSGVTENDVTSLTGFHANGTAYQFSSTKVKSWLGLGSNAYTSTAYLPLTGGNTTGTVRMYSNDASGDYNSRAIELREVGLVTSSQTGTTYAPSIGFHWGGVIQRQIALLSNGNFVFRSDSGNGNVILHDGNYNSYSPTLIGTGASGTWGINVTGNAATASNATELYSPTYNNGTTFLSKYDAQDNNSSRSYTIYNISDGPLSGGGLYNVEMHRWGSDYGSMIAINTEPRTNHLYLRSKYNNSWSSWNPVLDAINYSSYALPLNGGTLTGALSGTTGAFSSTVTATAHVTSGGNSTQTVKGDGSLSVGYKVYTVLLNQSGTSAPSATILDNTLSGAVVWSYSSTGAFTGVLAGAFTGSKCFFSINSGDNALGSDFKAYRVDGNTIKVLSFDSGTLTNGMLTSASLEVRVYN